MVKQKKSDVAAEDKELKISFKDYLQGQNLVVLSLNVFQNMTQNQLNASVQQLNAIGQLMSSVHSTTKSTLGRNGIDTLPDSLDGQYKEIAELLTKDASALVQAYNLPTSAAAGAVAAAVAPITEVITADGVKIRKKRAKKPKDPNAPKKPQTAYFLYLDSNRERLKEKFPDLKAGEIQQKATESWNAMAEDERDIYKAQYRKNFDDYKEKMKKYAGAGGVVAVEDLKAIDDVGIVQAVMPVAASVSSDDSAEEPAPRPTKGKGKKAATPKEVKKVEPTPPAKAKAATPKKKKGAKEDDKPKAAEPEDSKKRKRKSDAPAEGDKKKKPRKSQALEL